MHEALKLVPPLSEMASSILKADIVEEQIKSVLKKLDPNSAPDLSGTTSTFFKLNASLLAPLITKLGNEMRKSGRFLP